MFLYIFSLSVMNLRLHFTLLILMYLVWESDLSPPCSPLFHKSMSQPSAFAFVLAVCRTSSFFCTNFSYICTTYRSTLNSFVVLKCLKLINMIHCVATDVNIAADDNISHYLDIEEVEKKVEISVLLNRGKRQGELPWMC